MYHSWWFLLLLVLFTVNLLLHPRPPPPGHGSCGTRRPPGREHRKALGLVERWKKKGNRNGRNVQAAWGRRSGRAWRENGTIHLYAEKGVVSRFGVYVTHLSIIIIFIGAIIGNVFGFKGLRTSSRGSRSGRSTRGGTSKVDLGFGTQQQVLGGFYPSGQPKEYSSDLSIIENGREVLRKKIEVNDPLQYKGIWFYQSSYGPAGASNISVAVNSLDGGRGTFPCSREEEGDPGTAGSAPSTTGPISRA